MQIQLLSHFTSSLPSLNILRAIPASVYHLFDSVFGTKEPPLEPPLNATLAKTEVTYSDLIARLQTIGHGVDAAIGHSYLSAAFQAVVAIPQAAQKIWAESDTKRPDGLTVLKDTYALFDLLQRHGFQRQPHNPTPQRVIRYITDILGISSHVCIGQRPSGTSLRAVLVYYTASTINGVWSTFVPHDTSWKEFDVNGVRDVEWQHVHEMFARHLTIPIYSF